MAQEANIPANLWEQIDQRIQQRVQEGVASILRSATITSGGLTIKGGFLRLRNLLDTFNQFYVGPGNPPLPDGTQQPVWIVRRADGTTVLLLSDAFPDVDGTLNQALTWRDRGGNIVLADDTDSGQGIARPYIPGVFYRARNADWPVVTSTSFETVYRAKLPKQQPRLYVKAWGANNTAGATGEIRVMVNGTQLASTGTTVFGTVTEFTFGPAPVAGAHMAELQVEIQARVASGTGGVQVGASQAQGMQS